MKKIDILGEPLLKQALTNQLLNKDYYSEFTNPPALAKIILVRYNYDEIKKIQRNEGLSYFGFYPN